MTNEQFVYWLQGFVELNPNAMLTLTQWQIVKDHLALVFKKETPVRGIPLPVSPRPTESTRDSVLGQPFKQPAWMNPNIQWPPGTIIC